MHIAETPFSRLALGDGWRTIVDRVGGLIATLGIVIEDAKAGLLGAFP